MPEWVSRRQLAVPVERRGELAIAAIACGLALVSAHMLVHGSASRGLALAALPLVVVWVVSRPSRGLTLGLILILAVPSWYKLGGRHAYQIAELLLVLSLVGSRSVRLNYTDYAVAAYIAIQVLDWLLQYNQPGTWHIVLDQVTAIGFYMGARVVRRSAFQRIASLILFAGTLGALTVIYEYARGHVIFVDPTTYFWNSVAGNLFRPGGIYASPPGAATVLCFTIFFGLAAVRGLRGRTRALAIGCLGVCVVALVLTFTRGNIIGLAVGLLVFLWLVRSPLLRLRRVVPFVLALAAALIVALPALEQNPTFYKGIVRPGTFGARESYWSLALPIATSSTHNLIFGIGSGALETQALNPLAPLPLVVAERPQTYTTSLHNQYIANLIQEGLVGVVALVVLLGVGCVPAARAARATRDPTYAAISASILAFAISCTVVTPQSHQPSFAMFMFTMGLAATAVSNRTRKQGP